MTVQDREAAEAMLRKARTVYTPVRGKSGPPALMKVPKYEVWTLVRSVFWANGYHLVESPALGKRALLLEPCSDHKTCQKGA